jgi:hypothetical protein
LLAEQGAKVSFLVSANLIRILKGLRGQIRFIPALKAGHRFDFQCALLSLPYRMGTDLSNIPSSIPYLCANPNRSAVWLDKIGPEGFKIGICWQSKPVGPLRSFPLRQLHALSQVPGVRLISLQKNYGLEQLATLPADMKIETLGDNFDVGSDAFIDTAAVMECLDLIITSDTSIAHLAGALGRPTWVALKCVPEWRWMLDRSDNPWYRTLRLFRQKTPNDWSVVFQQMTAELNKLVPGKSAGQNDTKEDAEW